MSRATRWIPYLVVVIAAAGFSFQSQRLSDQSKAKLAAEVTARRQSECRAITVENNTIISLIPKTDPAYQRVVDSLGYATKTICQNPPPYPPKTGPTTTKP